MIVVSLSQSFIKRQKIKTRDAVIKAASFVTLNERTMCKYHKEFFANHCQFPETKRGKYTRQCFEQQKSSALTQQCGSAKMPTKRVPST